MSAVQIGDFNSGAPRENSFRADVAKLMLLALPSIGFSLSRLLLGQMDFIMLTRTGTEPTAAIVPATFFVFLVQSFGMGVAMTTQTFVSQSMGRGQRGEGSPYVWQSLYIAAFFAAISPLAVALMPGLWSLIGHAPAVRELEIAYCQITLWSMALAVACAGLDGFFNGIQKPRVAFMAILAAVVVNGISNYVLIFGKLGFPAMGIRGAAIATVVAWATRAAILLGTFLTGEIAREYKTRVHWRINRARLMQMLGVGGPTGIQWLLDVGSWFVFSAWLIGRLGESVLAASNIAINYTYFSFMPAIGVGIAVSTLVGHSIGANDRPAARRYANVGMVIAGAYMALLGLVLVAGGRQLMALFSADAEVIEIGIALLIWVAVFQVFDAMQIIYTNALRGAGDTKWPAAVVALHCWVIFVGGGWLMLRVAPSWGYHGPYLMATIYIATLGCVLWWRWAKGPWERIDLLGARKAEAAADVPVSTELTTPDGVVVTASGGQN